MAKEYNYIYELLVDSDDDIHGIISYSVYKRQKIQFIKDFKQKHQRCCWFIVICSLFFVLLTGVLYFSVWSLSTSSKMVVEQIFDVKIISAED
ncbi:hypothetical protein C5469_06720 [Photorhabdus cinerea]|uniref:Uncharacterized protein n=1 Tax=Photorhabdus cinerea TaxID=471575 RepID=A0A7X5QCL9_9GAMM|nr:hypothetical protein [Photorhabdus cinerea]